MKHPFILILSLLCASTLYGQQKTWSLGECIETGIRNNLTLRNSRIDVQKKQTTLSLSRSYLLPKLEANFQAIDYLMKPANVTTGTLLGNDFPDNPTWQKIQSMQYGSNRRHSAQRAALQSDPAGRHQGGGNPS